MNCGMIIHLCVCVCVCACLHPYILDGGTADRRSEIWLHICVCVSVCVSVCVCVCACVHVCIHTHSMVARRADGWW
jgi:heme/copper-type cytochrome/quinol oxidase subunit 2